MTVLARETGGIAFLNSNDLESGVARIYQDTSAYYSIGVTLSKVPGAGQQSVRVDVDRPGVTVRARAATPRGRSRPGARPRPGGASDQLLLHGHPAQADDRSADPEGEALRIRDRRRFPAAALTFETAGGARRASADVSIAAMDDSGRMSETSTDQTIFTLPEVRTRATRRLQHRTTLRTRKGNHRIVVTVRDRASGRTGQAKTDVHVE